MAEVRGTHFVDEICFVKAIFVYDQIFNLMSSNVIVIDCLFVEKRQARKCIPQIHFDLFLFYLLLEKSTDFFANQNLVIGIQTQCVQQKLNRLNEFRYQILKVLNRNLPNYLHKSRH